MGDTNITPHVTTKKALQGVELQVTKVQNWREKWGGWSTLHGPIEPRCRTHGAWTAAGRHAGSTTNPHSRICGEAVRVEVVKALAAVVAPKHKEGVPVIGTGVEVARAGSLPSGVDG